MTDKVPSSWEKKRVAVIGSGFGGLAAAIRLQAAGLQVVLFEARDLPGGRAYVYRDKGFTFDAGPTVITAPHCLEELYALADRKLSDNVELIPVKPFYRLLWSDGERMDYAGETEAMVAQIRARHAPDGDGYLRFLAHSKRTFEVGYPLVSTPFLSFWDMVRVAPELIGLRADRSVYGTVARFVKDEHTRQALSFHSLLLGGNPFETSAIYTLIHYLEKHWGMTFPRGGTGALVQALAELFRDLGGELRLSAPVRAVHVEERDGKVVHLIDSPAGEREPFSLVVSNADVHHTYAKLYADHPRGPSMGARLARQHWSMSLFVLYFGVDRLYDDVVHHTILLGPRYRELLHEIFHGPRLPEDFSLYLHAPTVTDPTLAPPGQSTYYVLSPVPHLGSAPVDWEKVGPAYAETLLSYLERVMPGLRSHVVTKRWMTPVDFRDVLGSHHGSAFSVAPLLTQSAWFRPHNRDPQLPGLYIVGAGTHPGAGVPGVVNSAKATARVILEDMRQGRL
jgi:phytoene desaturase